MTDWIGPAIESRTKVHRRCDGTRHNDEAIFAHRLDPRATKNSIASRTDRDFHLFYNSARLRDFTEIIFSAGMYNANGKSCHPFLLVSRALARRSRPRKKTAKLNAFPKADGNRGRRSNPISTNLSQGKDKCVLLYGAARIYPSQRTFLIHASLNGSFIPLYRRRSRWVAENHCFLYLFLSLSSSFLLFLARRVCDKLALCSRDPLPPHFFIQPNVRY